MKTLQYPFTESSIRTLRIGEEISLTGRIYTGRDRLHRYLAEEGASPVDLKDGAIYHCGPVVLRQDGKWAVLAAGPTTSMRQEPYMARIIEKFRVRVVIGKGGMGEATRKACRKCGCVYLQAVGGAAVVLATAVEQVNGVHMLREFGPAEALWDLNVKGFRAIVAMDTSGRSLFKRVETASEKKLRQLLA